MVDDPFSLYTWAANLMPARCTDRNLWTVLSMLSVAYGDPLIDFLDLAEFRAAISRRTRRPD